MPDGARIYPFPAVHRFFRLLTSFLAAVSSAGALRGADAGAGEQEIRRELQQLLKAAQPTWNVSAALAASAGYKDNLLLSYANPEHSPFARLSVESLLWHVPRGNVDYFAFINAEGTRYTSGTSVDDEAEAFAGLTWRFRKADVFGANLEAQGYFLDQVLDISDTDTDRVVAELGVYGLKAGPTFRWSPVPRLWAELSGKGTRELFRESIHNSRAGEAGVRLGWQVHERVEMSVAQTEMKRRFDSRPRLTAGGRVDSGILSIKESETEGRLTVTAGTDRQWRMTTRGGALQYRDNGAGFLDYDARHIAQDVEWATDTWLVRAEGQARRKEYLLQTVGTGVAPPQQVIDEFLVALRVEKKLSDRWALFSEYSWERSRSNELVSSFRVNEGLLGMRWSWEK